MDAAALGRVGVTVLGLGTTTGGVRPLITEVGVLCLDDGVISAGPFAYWVAPDAPMFEVRDESWSQEVRLARPWPEVAEQVRLALSGRVLVTHDPDRVEVLRAHLPDWEPVGVAHTRELVEQVWPGRADYSLGPASALAGIHGVARFGPSAVV